MISLYYENGAAYVWDSDAWYQLRSRHRICGALIGSIPSFPRQNDFLGLPMALMSEEAALLVEKGISELVSLPSITQRPSNEEKERITTLEERVLSEQIDELKQRKIDQLSQKIDIIFAGKKQKLSTKGVTNIQLDKQSMLEEEINKIAPISPAHLLVHTPTKHSRSIEMKKVSINALTPSVANKEGSVKYSIFKDLWEKGYYITDGSKFGCHYLVYQGDPVKFHATYMVRCLCDQNTQLIHTADLVAFGRLAVTVNKLCVLAYCNNYGQIEYQTLQWHDSLN